MTYIAPANAPNGTWTFRATCIKARAEAWVQEKLPLRFTPKPKPKPQPQPQPQPAPTPTPTPTATVLPPSPVSAIYPGTDTELDVYAQAADNTLEHYYYVYPGSASASTPSAGWHTENLGGSLVSGPAAISDDGQIEVFGEAQGGTLEHYWYVPGSGWNSQSLGGSLASAPAVVYENGQLDVFGESASGTLEHWYYTPSGGWTTENLGGSITSAPAVVMYTGQINVFARSSSGTLEHYWYVAGSGWNTQDLGGSVSSAPTAVEAAVTFPGNPGSTSYLYVYARSGTGSLESYSYDALVGWNTQDLGGSLISAPAAVIAPTSVSDEFDVDVFAEAPGGTLEAYGRSGSQGWEDLGGSLNSAPATVYGQSEWDVFGATAGTLEHWYGDDMSADYFSFENVGGSVS
ncbi:MAG TPA: hypothetical protein VMD48_13840 [Solirubrobacteraceae bacterium]|nr:hypothetical protein [Solirubrobacteraceae bacterium]